MLVGVLIHASYVGIQYLLPLAMLWLSSPSDASTTLKLEVDGKYDETVDFVITQMGLLSAGAATILCMYFEGTVRKQTGNKLMPQGPPHEQKSIHDPF